MSGRARLVDIKNRNRNIPTTSSGARGDKGFQKVTPTIGRLVLTTAQG